MALEMSKQLLKKMCKDTAGCYSTPSVNDKLYLHYKGFRKIENLEEYINVKAIWLEGNGLPKLEGLEAMTQLRSIYLHENLIEKIEGLDNQRDLDALNLSKNFIKRIENLSQCTKLTNLNLSHNALTSADTLSHVLEIPSLQTLDVQGNKIDDIAVVEIFARMPDLRVLYLQGNPVVKNIKHYRKTIISKCQHLKYLDDRPVFDDERRRVNAWAAGFDRGGLDAANEAEREEINLIRREKDEADERNFRAFEEMIRQGQQIRRQREAGLPVDDVDSAYFPRPNSEFNPFSGERIVRVPEDDSLRLAREARWGTAATAAAEQLISSSSALEDRDTDSDRGGSGNGSQDGTSGGLLTGSGSDTDSVRFSAHSAGPEETSSELESDSEEEEDEGEETESASNAPAIPAPPSRWTSVVIEEETTSSSSVVESTSVQRASNEDPPPIPEAYLGDGDGVSSAPDTGDSACTDFNELD